MGGHQSLPEMWGGVWQSRSAQGQGTEELWGVGQCFLPPLSPCFLLDFEHKAKITFNTSGALAPRSEHCQGKTGCCTYSVLWHCLYPSSCAAAAFGLSDTGFNSLRPALPPTPGYLIVGMIISVIKTTMVPCCSLVATDRLRPHSEDSWVTTFGLLRGS